MCLNMAMAFHSLVGPIIEIGIKRRDVLLQHCELAEEEYLQKAQWLMWWYEAYQYTPPRMVHERAKIQFNMTIAGCSPDLDNCQCAKSKEQGGENSMNSLPTFT